MILKSKGCKYVIIKGKKRKIANLRREPTLEEMSWFNISMYPKTFTDLNKIWQKEYTPKKSSFLLKDYYDDLGKYGDTILRGLFNVTYLFSLIFSYI